MKSENVKTLEYIESKGFIVKQRAELDNAAAPNIVTESAFPVTLGVFHLIRVADEKPSSAPMESAEQREARKETERGRYLDDSNEKDRVTCRALFLRGVKGADDFDRAHALNYLQKVMTRVFNSGKGAADKSHGGNGRTRKSKGSKRNNGHKGNPLVCIIEDLAQDSFVHWANARSYGKTLDVSLCCRAAIFQYLKRERKHKSACLAFKLGIMEDKAKMEREENRQAQLNAERLELNADKTTRGLLEIVKLEGNARIKTLARGTGKTAYVIYRQLAQLKTALA
jgi:hypothetical protein